MKSLVWTRPASDWGSDQLLLKSAAGKAVMERLPCVQIQPLPVPKLTKSYDAFVFTSSKAAEIALADAAMLAAAKGAKGVYTHGPSTAKTLERFGLQATMIDARTGEELAGKLQGMLAKGTTVAWPRVEDPAHDLQKDLSSAGLPTDGFVCYQTVTGVWEADGKAVDRVRLRELRDELKGVVCFASPSAVAGFLKGLAGADLTAIAIGPTTAKACEGHFKNVRMAAENSVEALVKAAVSAL